MKKISKSIFAVSILLISTTTSVVASDAASKGYRYWGYFQAAPGATSWTAAMTGPTVDIKDGAVEGWSFVFSSDDIPSEAPSVKPDFATICAHIKPVPGKKRIGLVIDFGKKAYAPNGEKVKRTQVRCVRTAKSSQGIDVLGQVVKVRAEASGLICGFNGYPREECGAEIDTPAALVKKK
jgi:hypothetical protein